MNIPNFRLVGLIGSLIFSASLAHASVILYDGMDYATTADARTVQSDWTGTSFFSVSSPSLSYAGLNTEGNAFTSPNQFGREMFRSDFGPQSSGVYWLSFLVQLETATTTGVGLSLFNGGTELSFWGSLAGNTWGNASGGNYSTGVATTTNPTFIVLKLDSVAGKQWMWINPTAGAAEPELSASQNGGGVVGTAFTTGTFDRIRLGVFFGGGNGTFDEVRLGTTSEDVGFAAIPEPSTYAALAGAAILGFAASRRRRSA